MTNRKAKLEKQWQEKNNNWHYIYRWRAVANESDSDEIANLICNNFSRIKLDTENLRKSNFRQSSHQGKSSGKKPQKNDEKLICRALFNLYKELPQENLGKFIDYEVPLQEPKKGNMRSDIVNGDIDLLSLTDKNLFIIEAKRHGDGDSLLKAILEAYIYSKLVMKVKKKFYSDYSQFGANDTFHVITPTVLTFRDSTSGKQLLSIKQHRDIRNLLHLLNNDLKDDIHNPCNSFHFFLIDQEIEIDLDRYDHDKSIKCKSSTIPKIAPVQISL
jgi:hypothetical protein